MNRLITRISIKELVEIVFHKNIIPDIIEYDIIKLGRTLHLDGCFPQQKNNLICMRIWHYKNRPF